MEIFGGFMAMAGIFGFLLAVVWLILPFVVLAIKAKVDRSHALLEDIDRRLAEVERQLKTTGCSAGGSFSSKESDPIDVTFPSEQ